MEDSLTTCRSMVLALFQKHQQVKSKNKKFIVRQCSCLCHSTKTKKCSNNDLARFNESNFFTCKCSGNCVSMKTHCNNCGSDLSSNGSVMSSKKNIKYLLKQKAMLYKNEKCLEIIKPSTTDPCHDLCQQKPVLFCCPKNLYNFVNSDYSSQITSKHFVNSDISSLLAWEDTKVQKIEQERPSSYYEWEIPYGEVELGEVVSATHKGSVFRGRWHGDVMIYTRAHDTPDEISEFHEEVELLSRIRHENVVLFMGACINPPHLAIVTSVRKGQTLFTHLHILQTSFYFGSKFSITKQIAQGMGYLHGKGINLGKLCSRNIYLESKVKIGISDYTITNTPTIKSDYCFIPHGSLTYICPEIMRTVTKKGIYLSWNEKAGKKSDVYAYGTILYEILLGCYPLKNIGPESIIWKVSNGHTEVLKDQGFPTAFNKIIDSCWSYNGFERPNFPDLLLNLRRINIPRCLEKKLSLSDSGAINERFSD